MWSCWCSRVDNRCIKHFTCAINNCKFTTGTERWVPTQNHLVGNWWLHQKLLQVFAEYGNCAVFCLFGKHVAYFRFDAWRNQTRVTILDGKAHKWLGIGVVTNDDVALQVTQNQVLGCNQFYCQNLFRFATVYRQNAVTSHLYNVLFVVVVVFVNGLFLWLFSNGCNLAQAVCQVADVLAVLCIVGNYFRNDIQRTLNSLFCSFYALFGVDVLFSDNLDVFRFLLQKDDVSKWLQALFLGNACASFALWTVWAVQVVNGNLSFCRFNFRAEFVSKFALLLDAGNNLCLLFFQVAQIRKSFKKFTKLLVVERASCFLAVTGNERNCVTFVNQVNSRFHLPFGNVKFICNFQNDIHCLFSLYLYPVISRPSLLWHVALSYFVENIHNRTIIQNSAHFCNTLKAKFAKNNTPIFVPKLRTIS